MLKSVNSLFITYNWLYIYTIIKNKTRCKLKLKTISIGWLETNTLLFSYTDAVNF